MSEESDKARLAQDLIEETNKELTANPLAETGCCTVRTKGWSESYSGITKSACANKAGPGFTATWKKGDC